MNPSGTPEARRGPASPPTPVRLSMRTCVGCRRTRPKEQMLRLVCAPSGRLMVDRQGKLPGRGVYVCPARACAVQAVRGARLGEALRQRVTACAVDELLPVMAQTLEARAIACIRIARKAGRMVSGYTAVLRALAQAPVALLLVAEDSAPGRLREYEAKCMGRRIPYRICLTKARLGELAGREVCSAIGIEDARLSERVTSYLEGMRQLMAR